MSTPVAEIRPSWREFPMDDPHRVELMLQFTADQFERLKCGLEPEQMEDKWLIYYEDGWLHFCRSWTRFEIYKATLEKEKDEYVMKEFWAERNEKKWENRGDDFDRNILITLIAWGLLGIDVRGFYSQQNIKSEADSLKTWSIFGRMYFTPDLYEDGESK